MMVRTTRVRDEEMVTFSNTVLSHRQRRTTRAMKGMISDRIYVTVRA